MNIMKEVNKEVDIFYESSKGKAVALALQNLVTSFWGKIKEERILVIGYADILADILPKTASKYERGALNASNIQAILPFSDCSFDKILILHALEYVGDETAFIRELWRITEDGGKILFIVPNRRGIWLVGESTPFAKGRPYSISQLSRLLNDNMLLPLRADKALLLPSAIYGNYIARRERKLAKIFTLGAGALALEAQKNMYAGTKEFSPSALFKKKIANPTSELF